MSDVKEITSYQHGNLQTTLQKEPVLHVEGDDLDLTMIAIAGAFFAILVFIIVIALQAWFYSFKEREIQAKTQTSETLQVSVAEQLGRLAHYERTNPSDITPLNSNTKVRIPIERAMELIVQERKERQP